MDFYGRYLCLMRIIRKRVCIYQRTISGYLTKKIQKKAQRG
mgnify:CR=1 FL=1